MAVTPFHPCFVCTSDGRYYEISLFKKNAEGSRSRVEIPHDDTTRSAIFQLAQSIFKQLDVPVDQYFIINSRGICLSGKLIHENSDLLNIFLKTLQNKEEPISLTATRAVPHEESPFRPVVSAVSPTTRRVLVRSSSAPSSENPTIPPGPPGEPRGRSTPPLEAPEEITEVEFVPEKIKPLPLLTKGKCNADFKLNHYGLFAIDFAISQFKQTHQNWCIKNKNWYEELPLSLRLRILRAIQGGYSPRNQTSAPLCEEIRIHVVKAAYSEQPRLIVEEIARLEKLQRPSPLSPLLIQAEKIYFAFKFAQAKGLLENSNYYTETLTQIYTLVTQLQENNPTALESLKKTAEAAGIILNNTTIPPSTSDETTQNLVHPFAEVLALWIDNEGRAPWEEKPKTPFWGFLTQTLGF